MIDNVFIPDMNARINQHPNFIDKFHTVIFIRFQLNGFELKSIIAINLIHVSRVLIPQMTIALRTYKKYKQLNKLLLKLIY